MQYADAISLSFVRRPEDVAGCRSVMLNKGRYVDRAVSFLDDLLARMADHHHKKRSPLRRLRSWDAVGSQEPPPETLSSKIPSPE